MDSEQSLIARAQRGDAQAYESLVRQYEQIVFRAAWLVTRDEHEAADVAQESFVRAYRALGSFKMGQPFRPWLLRIVTNQALNRVKTAQRRARMTERYGSEMIARQEDPSPDHVIVAHEQNERLLEAVSRLADDEQTLIALRYFLELPEAEVADVLKVPLGTVKSRLHRTLGRLRDMIRREFPELGDLTTEF